MLQVARQIVFTQLPSQSRALVATATDFNTTENANTANKSLKGLNMRNDFKVYEEKTIWNKPIWRIRSGGRKGNVITNSYNKDTAEYFARQLNIDPWYFDRGHTRADRNKNG